MYLNISTLQQRIQYLDHEIDISLAEKKRPKKERELQSSRELE